MDREKHTEQWLRRASQGLTSSQALTISGGSQALTMHGNQALTIVSMINSENRFGMNDIVNNHFFTKVIQLLKLIESLPVFGREHSFHSFNSMIKKTIDDYAVIFSEIICILRGAFPNVIIDALEGFDGDRLPNYLGFSADHFFKLFLTSSVECSPTEFSIASINSSISFSDAGREGLIQLYSPDGSFTDEISVSFTSNSTNFTDFTKPNFSTAFKKARRLLALSMSTNSVFINTTIRYLPQKYKNSTRAFHSRVTDFLSIKTFIIELRRLIELHSAYGREYSSNTMTKTSLFISKN